MTILDGDGIYGANNTSPMLAPKGIVGRTDGLVATGMIGESLVQSFSSMTIAGTSTLCATISGVPAGRYAAYAKGLGAQTSNTGGVATIGGTATYTIEGTTANTYWTWVSSGNMMINALLGILKVTVTGTITLNALAYTNNITTASGDFVLVRIA